MLHRIICQKINLQAKSGKQLDFIEVDQSDENFHTRNLRRFLQSNGKTEL